MPLGPLSQPGASARLPDAPTGVSASAVSGGQASITFSPSVNPGKPSGNYVATASPGPVTGSASVSPIAITGLTVGTAYTFTVVKQSGSGITSNSSSATGSITAFAPPTFVVNQADLGTSTAATVTGTTSVSGVSTTTATLANSPGSGATFYDYQRISGTAVTPVGGSLSGLAQKTSHEWRARVTNNLSSFALTTKVTPNGSATAVSVAFGTAIDEYETNATSGGNTSINIGSGLSEVSTTWSLSLSSSAATIYWRATATYAGGATVLATGSIARAVAFYNATSVSFETYGTYTYSSNLIGASLLVSKRSYGVDMTSISGTLVGGGGGGVAVGGATGIASYAGGGGGGDVETFAGLSSSSISISRGAGGNPGSPGGTYGGYTTLVIPGYADLNGYWGTPGISNHGGATYLGFYSGVDNYNYGTAGSGTGGGGGGAGGAAIGGSINGGPALNGYGPGGPGYSNIFGIGGWGTGGTSDSYGAGGAGGSSGTAGKDGYFTVTYVGPYRNGGTLGDA